MPTTLYRFSLSFLISLGLTSAFVSRPVTLSPLSSSAARHRFRPPLLLRESNTNINGDPDGTPSERFFNEPTGYSDESGYSPFLTRREKRKQKRILEEMEANEDGYEGMKKKSLLKRTLRLPKTLWEKTRPAPEPGTLILVRHGESLWNVNQTFTGWYDADLSEKGVREVEHAARLLLEGGYVIDTVFTSRLKRAIKSVWILLQEMNESYIPVYKSWRL